MYVRKKEGIGIDFAIAFVLKVTENVVVELGVFLIGEEILIRDGSHQDVVDAGGGFYSCFSCYNILNETQALRNGCTYETLRYENEVNLLHRYCEGGEVAEIDD